MVVDGSFWRFYKLLCLWPALINNMHHSILCSIKCWWTVIIVVISFRCHWTGIRPSMYESIHLWFRCLGGVVSVLSTFFIEHVQLTLNYSPVNPLTKLACTAKSLWSPPCLQLAHNRPLAKANAFKWWPGIYKKEKSCSYFWAAAGFEAECHCKGDMVQNFLVGVRGVEEEQTLSDD